MESRRNALRDNSYRQFDGMTENGRKPTASAPSAKPRTPQAFTGSRTRIRADGAADGRSASMRGSAGGERGST